jgi:Zn-dependent protease
MFDADFFQRAIIGFPVIIFSLTVHEYFHAWTALKFGDPTARDMGRLTLNPIAHIDIMGLVVMVLSQFRFGWAKPVPVNPLNLRNPRVADIWISAAGPLSNFGMAIISAIVIQLIGGMQSEWITVMKFLHQLVWINLVLGFFNLIPLFPLDGSHILRNLLPDELQDVIAQLERVSPYILLIMLVTGTLWFIIGPPVEFFGRFLLGY